MRTNLYKPHYPSKTPHSLLLNPSTVAVNTGPKWQERAEALGWSF
jgi:hypothetical protein